MGHHSALLLAGALGQGVPSIPFPLCHSETPETRPSVPPTRSTKDIDGSDEKVSLSKRHNLSKFHLNMSYTNEGVEGRILKFKWHISASQCFPILFPCNNRTAYFVVFEHWGREQCSVVTEEANEGSELQ